MIAVDYWQLLLLGAIAGFTIFLGLPLARLQNVSPNKKGFLNAIAIGILVFLIIDVFSHAWESVGNVAQDTFSGKVSVVTGIPTILALFGGLGIGLLGLVFYESIYMSEKKNNRQTPKKFSSHNEISGSPLTGSDETASVAVSKTGGHL